MFSVEYHSEADGWCVMKWVKGMKVVWARGFWSKSAARGYMYRLEGH